MEKDKLIAELKAKHGSIRTLIVPLDEDDADKKATIYLRKPDAMSRDIAQKLAQKDSKMAIKGFLNGLYIGGDSLELVYNSEDAMESLSYAVAELISVQRTEIKKN
jgi:hypothetical protein